MDAAKYGFAAVAIHPTNVPLAAEILGDTPVKVCAAIAFPLGAYPPDLKAFETRDAINKGADEVDMVMNVGALKSGDYAAVREEMQGFVEAAEGKTTKVILETCLLNDEEKVKACEFARAAGADFVKTSTGFQSGATVEDVRLMRETVGENMGVKAAGGIRSIDDALAMIEAGANRLGTSSGVQIVQSFVRWETDSSYLQLKDSSGA